MSDREDRKIPEASVARLPLYLRCLADLIEAGVGTVSYGTRGVGYDVEYLRFQIRRELGLTRDWPVVVVGLGNLGQALSNYAGFSSRGFPIAALIDADPAKVGTEVHGHVIRHIDELDDIVADSKASIGIISVPGEVAQEVADRMVQAGIKSILNFAPAVLNVPDEISLRKVDLAVELQILSFYQERDDIDLAGLAG